MTTLIFRATVREFSLAQVRLKGVVWLGTRTARFDEMVAFAQEVLGLEAKHAEDGLGYANITIGSSNSTRKPELSTWLGIGTFYLAPTLKM